jgi:hypothetical protein
MCVAMLVVCVDNVVHEFFFNVILDVGQLLEVINNILKLFFSINTILNFFSFIVLFFNGTKNSLPTFYFSCKFENLCFDAMNWKNEYV